MCLKPFNLKVKIVEELFVGPVYQTQVWIDAESLGQLLEDEAAGKLATKLEHYAKAGFGRYTSKEGPIKSEGRGVFRIGLHSSLFRLLGFYNGQAEFIIVDAFLKKKQKLSGPERAKVATVAAIREQELWVKG